MNVHETPLPGVLIIEAPRFEDDRGWFGELWNEARYAVAGLDLSIVQTNVSCSRRGVLRGLHFQQPNPQGKLVTVLAGSIFDVAVDLRPDATTFGRWFGCRLSAQNGRQLWVPEGFAHGFLATSDEAVVHYGCTGIYDPSAEQTLAWDDPAVAVEWPEMPETISVKDRAASSLHELVQRNGWQPASRAAIPQPSAGTAGDHG